MDGNTSTSVASGSVTETRALSLLASGLEPGVVAAALGVSVSRISQLVSEPEFSAKLQDAKFQNLQRFNERDASYDTIEDKLISKLEKSLPFLMKPMEITRVLKDINSMKRRGISAPEQVHTQQTVVQLTIPVQLIQKFTTNIHNQVVTAGQQDLVTIGSKSLEGLAVQMAAEERQQKLIDYAGAAANSAAPTGASKGAVNGNRDGREEFIDI